MKKKILLTLFLGILLVGTLSAFEWGDGFRQNETVNIIQTCPIQGCNQTNLTIVAPNSEIIVNNLLATHNGLVWNYTVKDTNDIGIYTITGFSTNGTTQGTDYLNGYFEITSSGKKGVENIVVFLTMLVLLYTLTLLFFLKRDINLAPFTALAGMALGVFGVYMITEGFIIYRDWFSNYLAYLTIGVGFGLGLWSLIEWIEDNL